MADVRPEDFGAVPTQAIVKPEDFGAVPLSQRAKIANVSDLMNRASYAIGGAVTDAAAKHLPPEVSGALGYAANVGVQATPMLLGGELAKTASPILRSASERLMQSALKPGAMARRSGDAEKAVNTLLDEGINVSKGGVAKLQEKIGGLNDQIVRAIANSPATVDKGRVASALTDTISKFERQADPHADLAAIEKVWTNFLNHPLIQGQQIPVKIAQELKQGTYRVLSGKYNGELGSASIAAQKSLARGLKEEIAAAVPEVAPLNKYESELIRALKLAEDRVLASGNSNLGGMAWLTKNPAAWAAFMADKSSAFKSMVARLINAGQNNIPSTAARAGILAVQNPQTPSDQ